MNTYTTYFIIILAFGLTLAFAFNNYLVFAFAGFFVTIVTIISSLILPSKK